MSSRSLITVVACVLIGALGIFNYIHSSNTFLFGGSTPPLTSLVIENVDLGTLKPNEKKDFSIVIRNRHTKTIELLSPVTSCGCIATTKGHLFIGPGSQESLRFTYHAATRPSSVKQKVTFLAASDASVNWTSAITGKISADVWAEPASISFALDPGDDPVVELFIQRKIGLTIKNVVSDADEIKVSAKIPVVDSEPVVATVELHNFKTDGTCNVLIIGQGDAHLLTVPVRWKKRESFVFHPRRLLVSNDDAITSKTFDRRIILYRGPNQDKRKLRTEVLVPWVQLADIEASDSVAVLHLQLDVNSLPHEFSDSILKLSLDDGATWCFYNASVTRATPSATNPAR